MDAPVQCFYLSFYEVVKRAMAAKRSKSIEEQVSTLIVELDKAKTDSARHKIYIKLWRIPEKNLVTDLQKAFDSYPKLRWLFPSVLGKLAERRVTGVEDALRGLLKDKDPATQSNAAQVVEEF